MKTTFAALLFALVLVSCSEKEHEVAGTYIGIMGESTEMFLTLNDDATCRCSMPRRDFGGTGKYSFNKELVKITWEKGEEPEKLKRDGDDLILTFPDKEIVFVKQPKE